MDEPAQIVADEALTLIDGAALTAIMILALSEHPEELVPVTE